MKKRISFFLAFVLTFVLSGCGGGASFSSQKYIAETAADTAAPAGSYDLGYYSEEALEMNMASTTDTMEEGFMDWEGDASSTDSEISNEESLHMSLDKDNPTSSASLERKLIRNMDLTVETTDFNPLIEALQAKVIEFQGYIEQSDISGNSITNQGRPSKKYAHMTLRIPADKLDSFISQVEAAGNITYKSENVTDVTLQYSDIQSRLKTLRMEQERLWELLAQADTTEAIVLLEERLTEVSSEIESYESRMRYLDNSVTYSTVYLSINEVDIESPTKPETAWQQIQRGFTRNLIALMDNLTQFFINLLSNLPVILFFALLVFIIVQIVRYIKKHKKPKPPTQFPITQMHLSNNTDTPKVQEEPFINTTQTVPTVPDNTSVNKTDDSETKNEP